MRRIAYACLVAAMTAAAGAAEVAPRAVVVAKPRAVVVAKPRAVLELFTSQGCSSCPPADKLFLELARDPDLITLSLPVDYWDRLGWKDTFAKHAFTKRQRAYARVRGDGQVYTPQAVINGSEHANGSSRGAINAAAETTSNLSVTVIAERMGDDIVVSVGGQSAGAPQTATIVVLPYLGSREVAIGRGENAREKVTYTNIVRDIVPAGRWSGQPLTRTVSAKDFEAYDGIVVLLQAGTPEQPGAILGAARISIGSKV